MYVYEIGNIFNMNKLLYLKVRLENWKREGWFE